MTTTSIERVACLLTDEDVDLRAVSNPTTLAPPRQPREEKRAGVSAPLCGPTVSIKKSIWATVPGNEQLKLLKREVLRKLNQTSDPQIILVTSSVPGEGKSFLSFNLAASLTEEPDRTSVLVDADIQHPDISNRLRSEASRTTKLSGLCDLLAESTSVYKSVLSTQIPRLHVLPAGKTAPNASELLASQRMADSIEKLLQISAITTIVIDTPPVLGSTIAVALAPHASVVLYVVAARHTTKPVIARGLKLLDFADKTCLVFNKAPSLFGSPEFASSKHSSSSKLR